MNALLVLSLLAAEPDALVDAPLFDRGGRVRFGLSTQAGFQTLGGGFVIDADLRLGVQVTQWWSAYGVAKFHAGLSPSLVVGAAGLVFEVMATNHVALAVGPLLAFGKLEGFDVSSGTSGKMYVERSGGPSFKPGFDVKLSVCTGASRPPRFNRGGFNVGLELVGLVALDVATTSPFIGGPAATTPTPITPMWVFAPMLSLGMDFR